MKKITIYKNVEQQKKLEIEKILKLTPAERIANAVALIRKIYPEIKADTQKRIQFLNVDELTLSKMNTRRKIDEADGEELKRIINYKKE